ncbi:MAG: hypothetical protein RIT41_1386 [Bacteroidota bacterium]|jgi:nitric oxide reductase subunit C
MILKESKKLAIVILLIISFLSYSIVLYLQPSQKTDFTSPNADHGKMVWQKFNCNACHQIYSLGGYLGPDLTNIYALRGPDYIKALVGAGTATMPAFQLTPKEMDDLISYLQHIDASGKADPRRFKINKNGSIY